MHEVARQFLWRGRGGGAFYRPAEMETRHLFMTLVMIWNAHVPVDGRILRSGSWNHHLYSLGPFYTPAYLKQAVGAMGRELAQRDDLEPAWRETLAKMYNYLMLRRLLAEYEWDEFVLSLE